MTIPPTALLEKVCAHPKQQRPLLERPYLDTSDAAHPVVVATDGRRMAVVPVQAEATEEGYIGIAALKQARKADGSITFGPNRVHVLTNGMQFPREDKEGSVYPKWRNVLPATDRLIAMRLSLDPSALLAIAEAIDSAGGVTLEIEDPSKPIIVRPLRSKTRRGIIAGAYGAMMPQHSS